MRKKKLAEKIIQEAEVQHRCLIWGMDELLKQKKSWLKLIYGFLLRLKEDKENRNP